MIVENINMFTTIACQNKKVKIPDVIDVIKQSYSCVYVCDTFQKVTVSWICLLASIVSHHQFFAKYFISLNTSTYRNCILDGQLSFNQKLVRPLETSDPSDIMSGWICNLSGNQG